MALRLNDPLRSIIANGITGTFGTSAILKVYGGVQPGTGGATAGTQEIIVQISGIGWSSGSNGTAVIAGNKVGTAGTSGTALWARLSGSDGTSTIIDGVCGTAANADFVIDSASIANTAVVTLTAATIVQPAN